MPGIPGDDDRLAGGGGQFFEYQVNLLVDNSNHRRAGNLGGRAKLSATCSVRSSAGPIRWADRRPISPVLSPDHSDKAHGGFLLIDLEDAVVEPGVWKTLKRSLKTGRMTLETFEPLPFFIISGLKPEPIEIRNKVIVLGGAYLYNCFTFTTLSSRAIQGQSRDSSGDRRRRRGRDDTMPRGWRGFRNENLPPFDGAPWPASSSSGCAWRETAAAC